MIDKLAASSRLYGAQNTQRYREMFLYKETRDSALIDCKCVSWQDIKSLFYMSAEPPSEGVTLARHTSNSTLTLEVMDNSFFLRESSLI